MKNTALMIWGFLLSIGAVAQGQKDPAALTILEALSAKYKAYGSFKAEFVYSLINPDNTKEEISGTMTVKGDKYKLDIGDQVVINDGKTVWTLLKDVNELNISDFYPEDQEISVSTIFTIYENGYKYVYVESRDNGAVDVIDLEPEKGGREIYKIRMLIGSKESDLKSFLMYERSGVKYEYSIKGFNENANVNDAFFGFDEDKFDGDIIDFRN
ncbi:MAG: outer membrane lipoprotein carrier protein LolA [Bacteroidetes bacterium]|nr:outer membrane lipoprotein carrier protein LolA [Bacteroidota bacterium]MDA1121049.1 outer membrane lipoprotein carrier protein LolA [Bacteroidota bacterium]